MMGALEVVARARPPGHRCRAARGMQTGPEIRACAVEHLRVLVVGICSRNTLRSTTKVGVMPRVLRDFIPGMVCGGIRSHENFLRRGLLGRGGCC